MTHYLAVRRGIYRVAAVVLMNARRFISYGAVMVLPLQLEDPGLLASYHSRLDGRIASTFGSGSV